MTYAVKNKKMIVKAYQLGEGSEEEIRLLSDGKIRKNENGTYEMFSREAMSGIGEIANEGDYFKVDEGGYPYPNKKEYFLSNHRHIKGYEYEQINRKLLVWREGDQQCEQIRYLLKSGELRINRNDREKYFHAFRFGTELSAPEDAVIVIYSVNRDIQGEITDIDFNFVSEEEFKRTYSVCK